MNYTIPSDNNGIFDGQFPITFNGSQLTPQEYKYTVDKASEVQFFFFF
jgi:hypothetical protein